MSVFQIIMLLVTAFFAYQVYMHIQNIDEDAEPLSAREPELIEEAPAPDELIEEEDRVYMEGDLQKAKSLLEKIVMQFPDFAEGMNKLAFVLARLGDAPQAYKYYKASLELEPMDDTTHNAVATLLVSMDRFDEAEEHYKKAIEIDDNYEITWFNYANLMQRQGKPEEARRMYQRALEISPDFQEAKDELEQLK